MNGLSCLLLLCGEAALRSLGALQCRQAEVRCTQRAGCTAEATLSKHKICIYQGRRATHRWS